MSSTTLTSWALLIWQTLQERGQDPRSFFRAADLDTSKLGDGDARYPVKKLFRLWQALEALNDPYIGIDVGQRWSPTTFHALGFAWLASSSLNKAMRRLTRYCTLVNNSLYVEFKPDGSNYRFEVATSEDTSLIHNFGSDAGATAVLKMCRMLCGEQFSPLEIHALRAPTPGLKRLEDLYRRPIHYQSNKAFWIIDRLDVERSVSSGNSELARINEQVAENALLRMDKQNIPGRVRQKIIEGLPSGQVDEEDIARNLGLSVRSLQRKLGEENLSFSKLVSEIRENLARHYIREAHMSLSEISYLLGFAEQASFTRAFRRWTGVSPSAYRKSIKNKAA